MKNILLRFALILFMFPLYVFGGHDLELKQLMKLVEDRNLFALREMKENELHPNLDRKYLISGKPFMEQAEYVLSCKDHLCLNDVCSKKCGDTGKIRNKIIHFLQSWHKEERDYWRQKIKEEDPLVFYSTEAYEHIVSQEFEKAANIIYKDRELEKSVCEKREIYVFDFYSRAVLKKNIKKKDYEEIEKFRYLYNQPTSALQGSQEENRLATPLINSFFNEDIDPHDIRIFLNEFDNGPKTPYSEQDGGGSPPKQQHVSLKRPLEENSMFLTSSLSLCADTNKGLLQEEKNQTQLKKARINSMPFFQNIVDNQSPLPMDDEFPIFQLAESESHREFLLDQGEKGTSNLLLDDRFLDDYEAAPDLFDVIELSHDTIAALFIDEGLEFNPYGSFSDFSLELFPEDISPELPVDLVVANQVTSERDIENFFIKPRVIRKMLFDAISRDSVSFLQILTKWYPLVNFQINTSVDNSTKKSLLEHIENMGMYCKFHTWNVECDLTCPKGEFKNIILLWKKSSNDAFMKYLATHNTEVYVGTRLMQLLKDQFPSWLQEAAALIKKHPGMREKVEKGTIRTFNFQLGKVHPLAIDSQHLYKIEKILDESPS